MPFYFDHNASTPVSPEALEVFLPLHTEHYGNASSIHSFGQAARGHIEIARREVAQLLGCEPKEITFVSGGTESDNLALFGALRHLGAAGRHIITSQIEHPAVLNCCARLEHEGAQVTYLGVDAQGLIDPAALRAALRPETALVSLMHANNETGVVQPLAELAAIARAAGALVHSDGVQAAGKIEVNLRDLGVDLYTISGHKLYAPKGVGALFVREGLTLDALLYGGRHERERRAGTENAPGIAALGRAARWLSANAAAECARLSALRERLEQGLLAQLPDIRINGQAARRTPNTANIAFDGISSESLVIALDLEGFAVSGGSACSSGAVKPSHVLTAMGMPDDVAKSCIRFSLGRSNDASQVDALIDAVVRSTRRLRRISPTYSHA